MATIDIGKIAFTQKGTWSSATAYTAKDVVQYTDNGETSSYVAVAASTNQAPATNGTINTTYWNIFAKGSSIGSTNQGTWDSATAYNKNDVVQFTQDGTHTFVAVQSSTNQTPQTLGVVNTAYWTKLASGVGASGNLEVLASVDASSSASLSVDGYFNDNIYGFYKIVYQDLVFSHTNYVRQRALISSGELSSSVYSGMKNCYTDTFDTAGYYLESNRNTPVFGYTSGLDDRLEVGRMERTSYDKYQYRNQTGGVFYGTVELGAPEGTHDHPGVMQTVLRGGNTSNGMGRFHFATEECKFSIIGSTALTGWKIYPSSGTITSGTMTLYGFKK